MHSLAEGILCEDKRVFFDWMLGTLSHLMISDWIWIRGFHDLPNYSRNKAIPKPIIVVS